MEKKSKLKWKPVALDQTVLSKSSFEGLIGIEELSDYTFKKSSKFGGKLFTVKTERVKKNEKSNKKRKRDAIYPENSSKKKQKTLELNDTVTPENRTKKKRKFVDSSKSKIPESIPKKKRKTRKSNSETAELAQKNKPGGSEKSKTKAKKSKSRTSVVLSSVDNESIDDGKLLSVMTAWNDLFVPITILKALNDLGFKEPTQIQALSLPSAIMGRKDMMGAAETGSGKTLAFGIPILAGIMKAKKIVESTPEEDNPESVEKEEIEETEDIENVDKSVDSTDEEDSEEDKDEVADEEASTNEDEGEERIASSEDVEFDEEMDSDEDNIKNENIENEMACVRVINNVKFPFSVVEENKKLITKNRFWALILTPTRELAIQVYKHLLAIAKYTGIQIAVLVGGMAQQKQERMLRRCPEVVVATPGRLWELIQGGNSHLSGVDQIRFLAVDEADRMLEAGHFQELKDLLERINRGGKTRRQNFVFSATLSLVHEGSKRRKGKPRRKQTPGQKLHSLAELIGLKDPKIVDVTPEGATAGGLMETRLTSSSLLDRDVRLASLLTYLCHTPFPAKSGSAQKTIVFCNSVGGVRRLSGLLSALQLSPITLHAGMQQRQRLRSLEKFAKGGILLATDVAARGLDLPLVDHVVHFQVPRTSETYVHRSGRTARGHREGLSVLLVEPKEVPFYNRLCRTLGKDDGLPLFPLDEQLVKMVKERVRLAREVDFLEHQLRRANAEGNWLRKTMEEADIMLDEDDIPKKYNLDNPQLKKELNSKKKELDALLKKTLLPMGFSPRYPTMNGGLETPKVDVGASNAVHVVKSRLVEKEKKKQGNKTKKKKRKPNPL